MDKYEDALAFCIIAKRYNYDSIKMVGLLKTTFLLTFAEVKDVLAKSNGWASTHAQQEEIAQTIEREIIMPKINRIGQLFMFEGQKYEVVEKISGQVKWILQGPSDKLAFNEHGMTWSAFGNAHNLDEEIMPFALRLGGFYETQDKSTVLIYKKSHGDVYHGMFPRAPDFNGYRYDSKGDERQGAVGLKIVKEVSP